MPAERRCTPPRRGPLALVELLIRNGALEWQGDRKGRPPLAAAKKGDAADKAAIVELLDRPVIRDRGFRAAVAAIRRGDVAGLTRLLDAEPRLLRERIVEPECYREAARPQYFRDPKLFWFIANNPTLMKRMPDNIVEVAEAMIARGVDKADLDYALELVMTSSPAREQGLQIPLVELLLRAGATATTRAIDMTLGHRELAPILALLRMGHRMTASIAAALGRTDQLAGLLDTAPADEIQNALGMAVINGQIDAARLALEAGADPNRFLPVHAHSLPLHQAALDENLELMELMAKEILCGFGIDVDAVAGWLGSYGGEDSPDDISRGLFAGEVGSPRLLKLFARLGIKTTWFIPGHSIETFPEEMKAVAEAGHEIGIHGYSHENPIAMTREQETEILDKCIELVTKLSGKRPTGYVAPWWEFSPVTNELLLERGIKYDHFADAQRPPALLRAGRRQLDQDRLRQEAARLDGAAASAARRPT